MEQGDADGESDGVSSSPSVSSATKVSGKTMSKKFTGRRSSVHDLVGDSCKLGGGSAPFGATFSP